MHRTHQILSRIPTERPPFDVYGTIPNIVLSIPQHVRAMCSAHIISTCVTNHVVERISLRNIFCRLADNDNKFDFVVWKVFLRWLCGFRNNDWGQRSDEGRYGFVEENREAVTCRWANIPACEKDHGLRWFRESRFCLGWVMVR